MKLSQEFGQVSFINWSYRVIGSSVTQNVSSAGLETSAFAVVAKAMAVIARAVMRQMADTIECGCCLFMV